jgi:hypothetical protein
MRKWVFGLVLSLTISSLPAYSVEFGVDATGDPNAVKVGGASGFLYSDRIIFTAAHVIESTGGIDYWEKEGVIYPPGIVRMEGQIKYKAKRVLVAPTYRPRTGDDQTRIDDFAIIILKESIPMKNEVLVATPDDINLFIMNKTPVTMIGYGFQNSSQRDNYEWASFSPMRMTSFVVSNKELRNYYAVNENIVRANQTMLDFGIVNSQEFGSVCDGDSGSGFFVEKGNVRYYLGLVGGSQAGIPNCRSESWARFGIGGGMSGITATYKFLSLIREAEDIVSEDKRIEQAFIEEKERDRQKALMEAEAEAKAKAEAEAKAKAEAEAKAKAEATTKKTITCIKGKLTKKVTGTVPKCPAGYKRK